MWQGKDRIRELSGDGFRRCSDGQQRWGLYGAAGVLFVVREDAETRVLLQRRTAAVHDGDCWSIPGGALAAGEHPLDGALRESVEEIGPHPEGFRVLGSHVFAPADDWSYTTTVVEVAERFGTPMTFESEDIEWVPLDEVERRPCHPGFAHAWPRLREIIERAESAAVENAD